MKDRGESILKGECLVIELMVDYLRHVDEYYSASNEPSSIRYALHPIRDLFGRLGVDEISPRKLKAARDVMIAKGWSRTGINKACSRILRMFKWGVAEELVQPTTYQALKAVEPLKYGRCGDVRETKPVKAVDDAAIEAVRSHVLPEVWAMIQVQRHSGMRPGEVCELQGKHIERAHDVWIYKPDKHKNAWRKKERIVFLGPSCQRAILPFLIADPDSYIFSPRRALERRRQERVRSTPVNEGNRPGYSHRSRAEGSKMVGSRNLFDCVHSSR